MFDEEKTTKAVEKISPSVVNIVTKRIMGHDRFNTYEFQGAGSGVIMNPEGYILTNNHVVEQTKKVDVYLCNGEKYEGAVIGTDPSTDIAVIKINGDNFYSGEFGNSDTLRPGQMAIVTGIVRRTLRDHRGDLRDTTKPPLRTRSARKHDPNRCSHQPR
jgi:S1-C subfamily serine protease